MKDKMSYSKIFQALLAMGIACLCPAVAAAGDIVSDVKENAKALCEPKSRLLGSPGHDQAKEMLAKKIVALEDKGVKLLRQPFTVMVPTTKRSQLTVKNGTFKGVHRVYPIWPDNVRMKTTPKEGISGKPVYINDGRFNSLPAKSLRGNIAVMEMSANRTETWMRAFEFGAKAVLLLGSEGDSYSRPKSASIYKPRFYVPEGSLCDALKKNELGSVTINCDAAWADQKAENLIALLPGTDPKLKPMVLVCSYDAMSIVPDLAPGADNAVDAAYMLRMLEYLTKHRPKRNVVVGFIDAFGFNLMGMRELASALTITPEDITRKAYEEDIAKRTKEYEEVLAQVEELGKDAIKALPQLNDTKKYKLLQRYVKDVMSPEILKLREEILQLRLDEVKLETDEARAAASAELEIKLTRKGELDSIMSGIISTGKLPEDSLDECAEVWKKIQTRCERQLAEVNAQSTLFTEYDALHQQILDGLNIKAPVAKEGEDKEKFIPFPFVLGIDLSDSCATLGTPTHCYSLHMNYARAARPLTRWLKTVVKSDGSPYRKVPADRLAALGLRADGLSLLVGKILASEDLTSPDTEKLILDTIEGIKDDAVKRILSKIGKEKEDKNPRLEEVAFRILCNELSDVEGLQVEKLVCNSLNQESLSGRVDAKALAVEPLALHFSVCPSFEMSGASLTGLEGIRYRLDTPQDTYKHLDWTRLEPQIRLASLLIEMALNDPSFKPVPSPARQGTFPRWRMNEGYCVSESVAETIARTPVEGMLATSFNTRHSFGPPVGVRNQEFVRSGSDGRFRFPPAPRFTHWSARRRLLKAYGLAEDGRIVLSVATITSMLTDKVSGIFEMSRPPPLAPLRAVIFECVEVNGPQFRDPRYQKLLGNAKVLDVNRGGVPKKHFWSKEEGPMFGLLQPETDYQLVLGLGGGKNRMALLNVPDDLNESGKSLRSALKTGFKAEIPLPEVPELISARDFYLIDEWRLRRLEGAGVVCKAIREIHDETPAWLRQAEEAYENDDGATHKQASASALANEIRVYQAVQDQANDVTRGAIFLLLLLVPFAIAMERLLFASPEIGKQIGKSMLIFVIMFAALASFHPGFRITSMPAVILIAFVVLLLSTSVINMILTKFRSDMEELRRGTLAEASGAQTGRGGVIVSAIWLGIANMRKRMVRTLLTGLTIVLVTFSLLCFTSSSTYQQKRTTTLSGVAASHRGTLLQHPASQALDNDTEESTSMMLGGKNTVVGRYWAVGRPETPLWRIHARNSRTNELVKIKAGLGLRPEENQFSNIDSILKDWDQFANGDGCYVSEITARKLGVEVGETIVVAGVSLKLLDAFDGRKFENEVQKLDGQTLLPIDYTVQKEDAAMGQQENMESAMTSGGIAEPDPTMVFVTADDVIILPVDLTLRLESTLRSVAVLPHEEETRELADRMVKTIVYPIYYGAEDGVKVIVSTPLIPKAPRKLFIPILIAVLIIFNTMLNSIAERKKEIYIYSSLGLAPKHIGILFLAEALTYGVMGSVFGYVIGQGVAKVLTGMDLMGGITLNYSGSNVIMTMGLVLAVVVLSALVPAFMAAKVASPSGDLDWKVPQPKNGVIRGQLPFTVSQQAAPGLAAFLHEFITAHAEGAIGSFTSDGVRIEPGEGDTVVRLKSTIWPAPYDLGVRQEMTIDFDKVESDICDLRIKLEHGAGPERSWWRLNRVFLGIIRSQLLGWRNIAPERMLRYIRQSEDPDSRGEAAEAADAPTPEES